MNDSGLIEQLKIYMQRSYFLFFLYSKSVLHFCTVVYIIHTMTFLLMYLYNILVLQSNTEYKNTNFNK